MNIKRFFASISILVVGFSFSATAQEVRINKNKKLPPFPDLVIMRADYDQAKPSVTVRLMNRAMGSKAGACTLKLFGLRHKGLQIVEKLELAHTVPALAGGESYVTAFDLPKPEDDIKTALSKVVVDSDNVVKELKESNNVWSFLPKDNSAKAGDGGFRAPAYPLGREACQAISRRRREPRVLLRNGRGGEA
jgi:CARDB protein